MNDFVRITRFGWVARSWLLVAVSVAILTTAVACTSDPDPTSTPVPEPTATTTPQQPTATTAPPATTAPIATTAPPTAAPEPVVEAVETEPLSIVATSNIVGEWVSIVGGDRVDVLNLIPRGADPHAYQPGARDIARVADADLVFAVGLTLEDLWFKELVENAAADHDAVFEIAEHVDPIPFEFEGGHDHGEEAHDEDEDGHAHDDEEDEHAHEEDEHGHDDDEHMEHEEGEHVELTGRLLVGDADSGHLVVVDLMTEEISELDIHLPGPVSAIYASPNHRFGYAIYRGEEGDHAVHTIDGGVFLVPHGDHEDLVVLPVSEVGLTVNDEFPIHFTNGGEWSAIFHDGSGRAALLNEHEIEEEGHAYEIPYLDAGPQHGAAVPIENDLFAVTVADPDHSEHSQHGLPIGVEIRNLDDQIVWDESRESCPGMHGEAHNHHGSIYGCNGGVLFIEQHEDDFHHWFIENGEGMREGGRVGALWGHDDSAHFFGWAVSVESTGFENAGIWMIDPEEQEMVEVLAPSDGKNVVTAAFSSDGSVVYVLTYDGMLNSIDAADGDFIGETQLTEPVSAGGGDAVPSLIVVGETLFMSDSDHKQIVAFDLEHMEVAEEWTLDVTPTSLAFVGIVSDEDHPVAGHEDEHAHEDEDEHAHEDEDEHAHEDEDEHAHEDEDEHAHEDEDEHAHEDEHMEEGDHHDHAHGAFDPHFWFDPERVIIAVEEIAEQLSELEPASADYFAANRDDYIAELEELDHWIADSVSAIDEHDRILVTTHDAFGYFAARYGFTIAGVIIPGGGTEIERSPQEFAELVHEVEEAGASVVFSEVQLSDRLANTLAQEAGIRLVGGLHVGSLGPDGSGAENYIDFMRTDVGIIVAALSE